MNQLLCIVSCSIAYEPIALHRVVQYRIRTNCFALRRAMWFVNNSFSTEDEEAAGTEEVDGGPPLFYQPGKKGVYAPTSWGEASELRLNAYRNVGRIIGLCLLQNELCPLPLCRHVLKVLLNRKVSAVFGLLRH